MRSKLRDRDQKTRLRLKRASLAHVLQKIAPAELAYRNHVVNQFEFNRTVEALRRHFVETTDSGVFLSHLEMSLSSHREEYISRREVSKTYLLNIQKIQIRASFQTSRIFVT